MADLQEFDNEAVEDNAEVGIEASLGLAPSMEPIVVGGVEFNPTESRGQSPTPLGFVASVPVGVAGGVEEFFLRWESIFDWDKERLSTAQMRELIGDRDMPLPDSPTDRGELERRMVRHDFDQWRSQYHVDPLGEMVGSLAPMMFEPGTLATLPVGGVNFARAAASRTFSGYFKNSAAGGYKAALAAIPAESAIQYSATGEINGAEVVAASAASFLFPLAIGTPLHVLRGIKNARGAADVARSNNHSGLDPVRTAEEIDSQASPPRAPPVGQYTSGTPSPTVRLEAMFRDFEGGFTRWFRAAARGDRAAVSKMQEIINTEDVDLSAREFREIVSDAAISTAESTSRSTEDLVGLVDTVRRYRESGFTDPNARTELEIANMVDPEGNLQRQFADLDTNPRAARRFTTEGPEKIWSRKVRQQNQKVTQTEKKLVDAVKRRAKLETVRRLRENLRVQVEELGDSLNEAKVVADNLVRPEMVAQFVEVARIQRAPSYDTVARQEGGKPNQADVDSAIAKPVDGPEADLQDAKDFARDIGLPEERVRASIRNVDAVKEAMLACRAI